MFTARYGLNVEMQFKVTLKSLKFSIVENPCEIQGNLLIHLEGVVTE